MDTFGQAILSFIEKLSSIRGLKCTSIIEKGPQSVSFIERFFFLLCPLLRVSIIRGSTVALARVPLFLMKNKPQRRVSVS